jgi:hypothetical protein
MRTSKPKVFICVGLLNDKIIADAILVASVDEAKKQYFDKYGINPDKILGPYLNTKKIEHEKVLRFSSHKSQKAIYNDWLVNAFLLHDPPDHAYLIFVKKPDDVSAISPRGTIIVPIQDLRFIENEK